MLTARSLIRTDDGFVEVGDFRGPVKDEDYVDGALELVANGKPLLTQDQADYIDQLWAYLVDGMVEVSAGREFTTHFPDCPIRVTLRPDARSGRLTIEVDLRGTRGVKSTSVPLPEALATLAAAARRFFEHMTPHMPGHAAAFTNLLKTLDKLTV